MKTKFTPFGLIFALYSLFFSTNLQAQFVTKNDDDGTDGTLRQEIADTPPGGTITFADGITSILLTSELSIEKELTITADSTSRVTIDAQTNSRIFNITSGPVTFNYLILKNGSASGGNGGAIIAAGADLEFNYTDILDSNSNYGGAAYVSETSNVTFSNGAIQGNLGFQQGGGIYIQAENSLFENALIDRNGSDHAGGGIYNSGGNLKIIGSTISNNAFTGGTDVSNDGAGVFNSGGDLTVLNSTFTKNGSRNFGGAMYSAGGVVEITDSEISNNYAQYAGGGVYLNENDSVILNNINFNGNTGSDPLGGVNRNPGGAIWAIGDVTINGGMIQNNIAGGNGGGISFSSGTLTINGTQLSGNRANYDGFGIGGGGIYCGVGTVIINEGTQITNNSVYADFPQGGGGGIRIDEGGTLIINSPVENAVFIQGNDTNGFGGGIDYRSTQTLDLNNIMINGNTSSYGGGVSLPGPGMIHINGGSLSNNGVANLSDSNREGGAIWNSTGTITIDGTLVAGNNADEKGGAIYNNGGTVNINNAEIKENTSFNDTGAGGGIYNDNGGSLTITQSILTNNAAVAKGGAIVDNSGNLPGTVTLTDVIIRNNYSNGSNGDGGGIYFTGNGSAVFKSVEISNNNADNQGGAIWNDAASINITTSTISGNSTTGIDLDENNTGEGGAIYNKAGNIFINASTVVLNNSQGAGGAIFNASSSAITTLKNTIVALNTAAEGNNLAGENGFVSADYNLIGVDSLDVFQAMANDLEGTSENPIDPMIDSLADNGGFTKTHALLENSPAYNAGNPVDDFSDQRGEAVFGGIRDIGAFEAQTVLGIDEPIMAANTKSHLYPNPSSGNVVQLNIPEEYNSKVEISVIELGSGKIVYSQVGKSGINTLKTAGLNTGTYVIRLISNNNLESLKMIISE